MSLSCYCEYDPEPGQVVWYNPTDYSVLATKRYRKCCSCSTKILPGNLCAEVPRFKIPEYEVECNIYGEDGEIPRASKYLCETCADLAFSLIELGYCFDPYEDQRALVREYAEMHSIDNPPSFC